MRERGQMWPTNMQWSRDATEGVHNVSLGCGFGLKKVSPTLGCGKHFCVFFQEGQLLFGRLRELVGPALEFGTKRPPELRRLLQDVVVEPLQVLTDVAQQTLMNEQQALALPDSLRQPIHHAACMASK